MLKRYLWLLPWSSGDLNRITEERKSIKGHEPGHKLVGRPFWPVLRVHHEEHVREPGSKISSVGVVVTGRLRRVHIHTFRTVELHHGFTWDIRQPYRHRNVRTFTQKNDNTHTKHKASFINMVISMICLWTQWDGINPLSSLVRRLIINNCSHHSWHTCFKEHNHYHQNLFPLHQAWKFFQQQICVAFCHSLCDPQWNPSGCWLHARVVTITTEANITTMWTLNQIWINHRWTNHKPGNVFRVSALCIL